jgi:hypothetical protein
VTKRHKAARGPSAHLVVVDEEPRPAQPIVTVHPGIVREQFEVDTWRYVDDGSWAGGRFHRASGLEIRAGNRGVHRVVPPAGEAHAYERQEWARRISVYVSPTGRSVRVWVDGREVPPGADSPA